MRLLIMGPPGAGKGTQAQRVAAHYEIPAISTGDMFRAMKTSDTPLARQLRAIVDSGGLVSDEITNAVVAERLTERDCVAGFLLDGYPRTLQQVEALDDFLASSGQSLDAVISLLADVDEVVDRLLKRAEVEGRSDDTVDTIRRRQAIYRRETEPLLEVYRDRGLLVEVDGLGAVEDVSARLFAALDSRSNELATQYPAWPGIAKPSSPEIRETGCA
jgi:adenylate kinase